MGRRKISIRAIQDDRNRSVTFLKRKQGLFKKAHELSVLCSVDVAVIVFGQNKKLYEYSSCDVAGLLNRYQYYGGAHEHKGPADFNSGAADGSEDEIGSDQPDNASPPHHGIVHQPIQNQPLQHVRRPTPSASPPMPNGMFHPRLGTPPQHQSGSRPASRTHIRRQSSNLVPQDHPHPQASQPMAQQVHYAFQQPNNYYQPQPATAANLHPQQQHGTPPLQQHHYTHPPPQQQFQHLYVQDQRRQSMPTNPQAPAEHSQHIPAMHTPPQPSRPFQSPPLPDPNAAQNHARQHGPFRRAEEANPQSLAVPQHQWQTPPLRVNPNIKSEHSPRSQSIDVGAAMRNGSNGQSTQSRYGPPAPASQPSPPQQQLRTASTSGVSGVEPSPSMSSFQPDAKRPRLTVQIPGEASEGAGSTTAESSPKETAKTNSTTPAKAGTTESSHSSGIVLPAPSPRSASAGAVLSAGATGPTNPFARPNIPPNKQNSNAESWRENIASPMSALPSRVMAEGGYMSSPSSMFPELGFGSVGGNNLASPAVYQPTPIQFHGPSFRDEPSDKRRKSTEDDEGPNKRAKS